MKRNGPFWLEPGKTGDDYLFPPTRLALREPNGLLAVGGDLSPERLLAAYRHGIFPWFSKGQPILWWSPDPRTVLFPHELHLGRSLRKTLRRQPYTVTLDRAFGDVLDGCAETRTDGLGTWITHDMKRAYKKLHAAGFAHSVESWVGDELVGGLYGIAIGRVFYGESMFARRDDASKVAFAHLVRQLQAWDFGLIDCQVETAHLERFGARPIARDEFEQRLERGCAQASVPAPWQFEQEVVW